MCLKIFSSVKRQATTHTLQIRSVQDDLAKGITIHAVNHTGQDTAFIDCKIYKSKYSPDAQDQKCI